MSVSFCLPHPVAVSAFMICSGLCACTEMLRMYVLYVSFGSKVGPEPFLCVAMRSAVLFIFRSRLFLYSAGSGVNRVQVVVSGFSMRLFCPGKNCCSFLISVYVYCVERFAHIECYSDCSRRGSQLVEPLCYGVVYCVQCRHCRVLCFVPVLLGRVWYVCGYVRKNVLLQCPCNY